MKDLTMLEGKIERLSTSLLFYILDAQAVHGTVVVPELLSCFPFVLVVTDFAVRLLSSVPNFRGGGVPGQINRQESRQVNRDRNGRVRPLE